MPRIACVLLVLSGCGRIAFEPVERPLSDWTERSELTILNASRDERLVDFPLLVALDPSRIDYRLAADDGRDLRFVDPVGNVLAHEIEVWDPTDRSIVWVRVTIPAALDSTITMVYGNPDAPALAGSDAWSDEHVGVYHFTAAIADATAARADGVGVNTVSARSPLGFALELSQNAEPAYGVLPYRSSFDDVLTISGWMRHDTEVQPFASMIVQPIPDISPDASYLGVRNALLYAEVVDGTNAFVMTASTDVVAPGRWTHLALVMDGAIATFYIDGVSRDSLALAAGPKHPTYAFFLGSDCDACPAGSTAGNSDFLDGGIDEIRLERVVRSALWIEAQVASMLDELVVFP